MQHPASTVTKSIRFKDGTRSDPYAEPMVVMENDDLEPVLLRVPADCVLLGAVENTIHEIAQRHPDAPIKFNILRPKTVGTDTSLRRYHVILEDLPICSLEDEELFYRPPILDHCVPRVRNNLVGLAPTIKVCTEITLTVRGDHMERAPLTPRERLELSALCCRLTYHRTQPLSLKRPSKPIVRFADPPAPTPTGTHTTAPQTPARAPSAPVDFLTSALTQPDAPMDVDTDGDDDEDHVPEPPPTRGLLARLWSSLWSSSGSSTNTDSTGQPNKTLSADKVIATPTKMLPPKARVPLPPSASNTVPGSKLGTASANRGAAPASWSYAPTDLFPCGFPRCLTVLQVPVHQMGLLDHDLRWALEFALVRLQGDSTPKTDTLCGMIDDTYYMLYTYGFHSLSIEDKRSLVLMCPGRIHSVSVDVPSKCLMVSWVRMDPDPLTHRPRYPLGFWTLSTVQSEIHVLATPESSMLGPSRSSVPAEHKEDDAGSMMDFFTGPRVTEIQVAGKHMSHPQTEISDETNTDRTDKTNADRTDRANTDRTDRTNTDPIDKANKTNKTSEQASRTPNLSTTPVATGPSVPSLLDSWLLSPEPVSSSPSATVALTAASEPSVSVSIASAPAATHAPNPVPSGVNPHSPSVPVATVLSTPTGRSPPRGGHPAATQVQTPAPTSTPFAPPPTASNRPGDAPPAPQRQKLSTLIKDAVKEAISGHTTTYMDSGDDEDTTPEQIAREERRRLKLAERRTHRTKSKSPSSSRRKKSTSHRNSSSSSRTKSPLSRTESPSIRTKSPSTRVKSPSRAKSPSSKTLSTPKRAKSPSPAIRSLSSATTSSKSRRDRSKSPSSPRSHRTDERVRSRPRSRGMSRSEPTGLDNPKGAALLPTPVPKEIPSSKVVNASPNVVTTAPRTNTVSGTVAPGTTTPQGLGQTPSRPKSPRHDSRFGMSPVATTSGSLWKPPARSVVMTRPSTSGSDTPRRTSSPRRVHPR